MSYALGKIFFVDLEISNEHIHVPSPRYGSGLSPKNSPGGLTSSPNSTAAAFISNFPDDPKKICIKDPSVQGHSKHHGETYFSFDRVFWTECSQEQVYQVYLSDIPPTTCSGSELSLHVTFLFQRCYLALSTFTKIMRTRADLWSLRALSSCSRKTTLLTAGTILHPHHGLSSVPNVLHFQRAVCGQASSR